MDGPRITGFTGDVLLLTISGHLVADTATQLMDRIGWASDEWDVPYIVVDLTELDGADASWLDEVMNTVHREVHGAGGTLAWALDPGVIEAHRNGRLLLYPSAGEAIAAVRP